MMENWDDCLWYYVCKTIDLCGRKVALTVFTEIWYESFFKEIKILTEKILFQEICGPWKQMLGINKKPFFLLKNIYLYIQSMISNCHGFCGGLKSPLKFHGPSSSFVPPSKLNVPFNKLSPLKSGSMIGKCLFSCN